MLLPFRFQASLGSGITEPGAAIRSGSRKAATGVEGKGRGREPGASSFPDCSTGGQLKRLRRKPQSVVFEMALGPDQLEDRWNCIKEENKLTLTLADTA